MNRSTIRRLHLHHIDEVRHRQPGQEWAPHWHDEWSFGAIVQGECRFSLCGHRLSAGAGDLVCIAPGDVHTGALVPAVRQAGVSVVMLYVPLTWFRQAGLTPPAGSRLLHHPALSESARQMDGTAQVQQWLCDVIAAAHDPAATAGLCLAPARQPATGLALLGQIRQAVQDGEHTVGGLARRCGVSRERLHRVVRQTLGLSPSEYLRAVRIHRARELLLQGHSPASVAADGGFADQAHFTRWFRRTFGFTPGDLVAAARENASV